MTKVSVSLLSDDMGFETLKKRIKGLEKCADSIHFDVMDGVYNPNGTWDYQGPEIINKLRKLTDLPFVAHLMISNPLERIRLFRACDEIVFHYEACSDHGAVIKEIKSLEKRAGIAIEPQTDVKAVTKYLPEVDLILVMMVRTGYQGQKFIDETKKIKSLARIRKENNLKFRIAVDGGINDVTGKLCAEAGADILASASYVLNNRDGYKSAIDSLKGL